MRKDNAIRHQQSRSKDVLSIRPVLNLDHNKSSDIETFQNITLRPILKLQHPITLSLLNHSKHFPASIQKVEINDRISLDAFLKKFLTSNIKLRNKIIGIIVGVMTEEEFSYYMDNSHELSKRIITMQLQRYSDTLRKSK